MHEDTRDVRAANTAYKTWKHDLRLPDLPLESTDTKAHWRGTRRIVKFVWPEYRPGPFESVTMPIEYKSLRVRHLNKVLSWFEQETGSLAYIDIDMIPQGVLHVRQAMSQQEHQETLDWIKVAGILDRSSFDSEFPDFKVTGNLYSIYGEVVYRDDGENNEDRHFEKLHKAFTSAFPPPDTIVVWDVERENTDLVIKQIPTKHPKIVGVKVGRKVLSLAHFAAEKSRTFARFDDDLEMVTNDEEEPIQFTLYAKNPADLADDEKLKAFLRMFARAIQRLYPESKYKIDAKERFDGILRFSRK